MKVSDVQRILTTHDIAEVHDIFNEYLPEFNEYKNAIAKKGSFIHLKIDKDTNFEFTKEHLKRICLSYINNILSEIEITFLIDIIIASINKFEDESILEILEGLTDPEINGVLTKSEVLRIYNEFNFGY